MNKKTKIICTMGPHSDNREIMKQLVLNGMDVARFNFSHGTHEEHKARYLQLREVADECDIPIAALLDTKGPEIRTCTLKDGKKVTLKEGQDFILTTEELVGDETMVQINYNGLNEDVAEGNRILIDDGLIELHVKYVDGPKIYCTVVNGGELGEIRFDLKEKTAWVEKFAENDPCDTWEVTDAAIRVILANNIEKLPKSMLFSHAGEELIRTKHMK